MSAPLFSDYSPAELKRVEAHWLRVLPTTMLGVRYAEEMLAAVRAEMARRDVTA